MTRTILPKAWIHLIRGVEVKGQRAAPGHKIIKDCLLNQSEGPELATIGVCVPKELVNIQKGKRNISLCCLVGIRIF